MYKKIVVLLITMGLMVLLSNSILAVGVRPLVLNFDLKPGASEEFELKLTPGTSRETVELQLFHPIQQLSGGLSYDEGDPERHPALSWVELEQSEVIVPAGEEQLVRGEVSVPYDASGSHTAVIMIEQADSEENQDLFAFKVRYAVRLNINIDRPGQRPKAELLDFSLTAGENQVPTLKAHIKNDSTLHFNAGAEVTVRGEDRRLIERVVLASEAAARAGRETTRIYPGSEVIFSGEVTEPLFPGTYDLQLFLQYADGRQLIERKTVTLEDEFIGPDQVRHLSMDPEVVTKNLRPGAAATQVIELKNVSQDPITVRVNSKEIEEDYKYSMFELGDMQLRGDDEFSLDSRDSERLVMVYRTPREAETGGYYGNLELSVLDQEGQQLETQLIELQMLIGEEQKYSVDIQDLSYKELDDEYLFSLSFMNTGNIHLQPEGGITLRDEAGDIVKRINLELQEDIDRILPETAGYLTGTGTGLEPGEYTAEIVVTRQNQELETTEMPVTID
ncbi:MAG: hypothetical protein ACOCZ3_01000 [Bacillota bacterium]